MYKKKYKIIFNDDITTFYDSSNVYYYLLEFVYGINCCTQEIPETILDICEGVQEWCECADVGEEYIDDKFSIKVIEKCN